MTQRRGGYPATVAVAAAVAMTSLAVAATVQSMLRRRRQRRRMNTEEGPGGYESLIGWTPLIKLPKLSAAIGNGVSIYAKMECSNPGGTGKDRAALAMLRDAESRGDLPPPLGGGEGGGSPTTVALPWEQGARPASSATTGNGTSGEDVCSSGGVGDENNDENDDMDMDRRIELSVECASRRSRTGGIVVEGTSGSTGISLASLCASRGHGCVVVMPDDQASEKRTVLECLGSSVLIVPNCAISNPNHYVNVARRIAMWINDGRYGSGTAALSSAAGSDDEEDGYDERVGDAGTNPDRKNSKQSGRRKRKKRRLLAAFMNQFENLANYRAHIKWTGPEIYDQLSGRVDAFVMSSGTGGTLAGVGAYLKDRTDGRCRVVLVDPPGSALYNKVKFNVAFASEQRERSMRRHRYDTISEGIGLDRITANFATAVGGAVSCFGDGADGTSDVGEGEGAAATLATRVLDDAIRVSDQEAVDMAHWLLREEGLFVGSSSAMNLVGAARVAASGNVALGSNVVTVVCDGGQRHLTRFWNPDFVRGWGLRWPEDVVSMSANEDAAEI